LSAAPEEIKQTLHSLKESEKERKIKTNTCTKTKFNRHRDIRRQFK